MLCDRNIEALKIAVEEHKFIRDISQHRLADGTLDVDGNLQLWEEATKDLVRTPLGENTDAWLAFIPAKVCAEEVSSDIMKRNHLTEEEQSLDARRGTILIAHGGGFNWRTGCEAGNVAWYFHEHGFNVAILSYSLRPHSRLESMKDMQEAIRILRRKKNEFGISDRVAVMGFSAGGMLAGNVSTHFDEEKSDVSDRPDAAVVGYGAFSFASFTGPFSEKTDLTEDEKRFWGRTPKERFYLSPEKHVTPDTPPMFIWQTLSEPGIYGMTLARALEEAGVSYELHIFPEGSHGLGIADGENDLAEKNTHVGHWAELCCEWLASMDI